MDWFSTLPLLVWHSFAYPYSTPAAPGARPVNESEWKGKWYRPLEPQFHRFIVPPENLDDTCQVLAGPRATKIRIHTSYTYVNRLIMNPFNPTSWLADDPELSCGRDPRNAVLYNLAWSACSCRREILVDPQPRARGKTHVFIRMIRG